MQITGWPSRLSSGSINYAGHGLGSAAGGKCALRSNRREREPGKLINVKQNDCGCVCSVHLIPPLPFG
jgi:hypothetical protein